MQAAFQRFWQSDAFKGLFFVAMWATNHVLAGLFVAFAVLDFVVHEVGLWRAARILARSPYHYP